MAARGEAPNRFLAAATAARLSVWRKYALASQRLSASHIAVLGADSGLGGRGAAVVVAPSRGAGEIFSSTACSTSRPLGQPQPPAARLAYSSSAGRRNPRHKYAIGMVCADSGELLFSRGDGNLRRARDLFLPTIRTRDLFFAARIVHGQGRPQVRRWSLDVSLRTTL